MKRSPLRPEGTDRARRRRQEQRQLREARKAWAQQSLMEVCAMCGSPSMTTGHHVIPKRVLRDNNVPLSAWFDLRNYLPLCMDPSPGRCHERHELFVKRVPQNKLPGSVWAFAADWGLQWYLEREYA